MNDEAARREVFVRKFLREDGMGKRTPRLETISRVNF
jgi:hypothetical protein